MYRELAAITGYDRPAQHGLAKAGEMRRNYLDASKARRELGWAAEVSLGEGLARTVEYLRE